MVEALTDRIINYYTNGQVFDFWFIYIGGMGGRMALSRGRVVGWFIGEDL